MSLTGQVVDFDPKSETFTQYAERLEHFFVANNITRDVRKKAILLSALSPRNYQLLRSLVTPSRPDEKSFDEIVAALQEHHSPKSSEIVERFKFHSRNRQKGETIATYVAELRALAGNCNFGASLNTMLRDRLVCGVNNETMQKRLLAESELTFDSALKITTSMEAATQGAQQITNDSLPIFQIGTGDRCFRCGGTGHKPDICKCKKLTCRKCGKPGHIQKVCKSGGQQFGRPTCNNCGKRGHTQRDCWGKQGKPKKPQGVHQLSNPTPNSPDEYLLNNLTEQGSRPLKVQLIINGREVKMEVDTGAAVSLVSEKTFHQLWPNGRLQPSNIVLRTYSGEQIEVRGKMEALVTYEQKSFSTELVVIRGEGHSLLGRNWMQHLELDWHNIHQMASSELQRLLDNYSDVFQDGLGLIRGYEAKICVDPSAQPRYFKARPVPYSLKVKIEEQIEKLLKEGVIEPVQYAEWAAPIVPVVKTDNSVRICGDFRVTVNAASRLDRYPIPKIEDLLATLANGKSFTKLDLKQAYQQLPLEESSKQYTVINTHKGLFRYNRLPYGISSAPGIFQRTMDNLVSGIPGVVVYLDDILISGATDEEHLTSLEEVLRRMKIAGLRLRQNKCTFMAPSVIYLGYKIDARGLHPVQDKVQAITDAPKPVNVTQLKSYLGLLSYYSRFLPNLTGTLASLYKLLRRNAKWTWAKEQQEAFEASKQLLTSSQILVHFDPKLPLIVACDASNYGIGAVLAHQFPDGSERPIGYVSRTLSAAEVNYSQIEKEGLACVFGVKKFHSYLYGHPFTLYTDHLPLKSLFNEKSNIPVQASSRIQRWSLLLSSYEYTIAFKPTHKHGNADAMSRLPLPEKPNNVPVPQELVMLINTLQKSLVTDKDIKAWTDEDPVLSKVRCYIQTGWPQKVEPSVQRYKKLSIELSTINGCILRGTRVIVPEKGRQLVLTQLHEGHPGIVHMKSLARMYTWWPGMNKDIEQFVSTCGKCQVNHTDPLTVKPIPWEWPSRPWSRLHIDYAGPLENKYFLVIVDAHTKWMEIFPVNTATSQTTITILRWTFSRFGLPYTIVSDNGTCFTSMEFNSYLQSLGIQHLTTAPYHPQSNGMAERCVQILKKGLKKFTDGTLDQRVANILFSYRTTPQSTTGKTPAELMFNRHIRSKLDLLLPNDRRKENSNLETPSLRKFFQVSDLVYVKNFHQRERWTPGKINKVLGTVMYEVMLEDSNQLVRRHVNQLRRRSTWDTDLEIDRDYNRDGLGSTQQSSVTPLVRETAAQETGPRYPDRERHCPIHYGPYVSH